MNQMYRFTGRRKIWKLRLSFGNKHYSKPNKNWQKLSLSELEIDKEMIKSQNSKPMKYSSLMKALKNWNIARTA